MFEINGSDRWSVWRVKSINISLAECSLYFTKLHPCTSSTCSLPMNCIEGTRGGSAFRNRKLYDTRVRESNTEAVTLFLRRVKHVFSTIDRISTKLVMAVLINLYEFRTSRISWFPLRLDFSHKRLSNFLVFISC